MKSRKFKLSVMGAAVLLLSLACGQFTVEVEVDNAQPTDTVEQVETAVPTEVSVEEETPGGEQYWVEVQDPGVGFRFAVPCFWNLDALSVDIPYERAYGYGIYNYPEEYPLSFPRSQIPAENGAIKVEFTVIDPTEWGQPAEISLADYIAQENSDGSSEVLAVDEVTLNGTQAVVAAIYYSDWDTTGRYYMLRLNAERLLRISVAPSSKLFDTADLQGVLNSITIDPNAAVPLPTHTPSAPPIGVAAPCIPEYAEAVEATVEIPEGNTACGLSSFESLDFLANKVMEYLQMRNTGGLRWDYLITDPFVYREWGGEAQSVSADQFATMLANQLYDPTGETVMTFYTESAQFPPLGGNPPEGLLGPGVTFVEVVYSEGWGQDGQGSALLYFAQDECGGYYWYGIVYDSGHFDK